MDRPADVFQEMLRQELSTFRPVVQRSEMLGCLEEYWNGAQSESVPMRWPADQRAARAIWAGIGFLVFGRLDHLEDTLQTIVASPHPRIIRRVAITSPRSKSSCRCRGIYAWPITPWVSSIGFNPMPIKSNGTKNWVDSPMSIARCISIESIRALESSSDPRAQRGITTHSGPCIARVPGVAPYRAAERHHQCNPSPPAHLPAVRRPLEGLRTDPERPVRVPAGRSGRHAPCTRVGRHALSGGWRSGRCWPTRHLG
jgi:hypothetical protein